MRTEWICRWHYIPGREKHFEVHPTLDAARQAMAKVLRDGIDLSSYLHDLRYAEEEDLGRFADFLEQFFTDLKVTDSWDEICPSQGYPSHFILFTDGDKGFCWEYRCGECPSLRVSQEYYGDCEPFVVDFAFDRPEKVTLGRVNCVRIQIDEHMNYGTSGYPLMILSALSETPQTQDQIIRKIWERWETEIDRKAVGRHLKLLIQLGFPVTHSGKGYYYSEEPRAPQTGVKYGSSAYPLMILQVLDGTPQSQTQICQKILERYGTKIGRKAVSRNLELLKAMGFPVEHGQNGYYRRAAGK